MRACRVAALALVTLLAACGAPGGAPPPPSTRAPDPVPSTLRVEVLGRGLEHPWDVGFLPDGTALIAQRPGRLALLADTSPGAQLRPVRADLDDVLAEGEGGLLGLVVHPDFADSRRFVTCQTHQEDGRAVDVRLVTWRLADDGGSAERVGPPLLTGLPVNANGRHSGCRPTLAEDGSLLVTTGDAADPRAAQDRAGLGGKVLRMDLRTGEPAPGNPFLDAPNPAERLLFSYGHRNPQGIAPRPGGQVFVAEHGPDSDDEINLLRAGGNHGWDPSRGGRSDTYDESVPMTDLRRFPDAVPAVWSSGRSTEAVCAATFLTGPRWDRFDGMLAVTALKGSKLLLFGLGPDGTVREVLVPPELDGLHGRLRAARQGPDGALYVTTSNGTDDRILRITSA
ncbi:glucose/arabinose dehydrogenase [Saccharopolyspora gloriosae]|uniref:Glucose/arabinose dehydrogenase n=1 Tax=Saccharopolyspora gloriosae TaxID=455344 RepID=A0A840N5L5_9PSEU|nr:PQQ-dependent sugar dehydrogenase [Saccharopolyspora gloriosae]MBB5067280.1 glucose/arabinose dehydrogenase [Saccharopolyspora gloriosae]